MPNVSSISWFPPTDKQRNAIEIAKRMIWWFYRALKDYKLAPSVKQAQLLRARFDRIFKRASTGYATLDRCSDGCFATRTGSCAFSNARRYRSTPTLPKNDIRAFVTKRKISGGTVSDKGRDAARHSCWGLPKPAWKLKLSFYEFIGARLGIPGPKIPPSQASSGQPPHKSNVARPGICPVYRPIVISHWI